MKFWKRWLFCALACLCALMAQAQYYQSGEDPANLRWSQLRVGNFNIIYPSGLDTLAYHYAAEFRDYSVYPVQGLGVNLRKKITPVVLHAYSAEANAMVAWTPSRMEFFTIPAPGLVSNLPWARSLVLHETRHLAQMSSMNRGFFRFLHFFIGEQSEALGSGYMMTDILSEGDAVWSETRYSHGGRGRQSAFLLPYQAYFADSVRFVYDKWRFGSYRHYIPNVYAFGYLNWSAGQAMNKAGLPHAETSNAVLVRELNDHPLLKFRAYRRAYGSRMPRLSRRTQDFYREYWRPDSSEFFDQAQAYPKLTGKYDYRDYSSPILLDDGRIVMKKSALSKSSRLVVFDPETQKMRTLCLLGNVSSAVKASKTHLYWTELLPDPRWEHRSYSVLCSYRLSDGPGLRGPKYLSGQSMYFQPSPTPDNRYIAVQEVSVNGKSALAVLRGSDLLPLLKIDLPGFDELKEIVWNGDFIYYTVLSDEGMRVDVLDTRTGKVHNCMPTQERPIRHLSYRDGCLYFDADFDTSSQIYSYNLKDKHLRQLTHARYSASWPLPTDSALYFVDYSRAGNILASIAWDDLSPQQKSLGEYEPFLIDELLADEQYVAPASDSPWGRAMPDTLPQPRHFRKLLHAFRIHSWLPYYTESDDNISFDMTQYYSSFLPGVSLLTQNDLGTVYGKFAYAYNRDKLSGKDYHSGHMQLTVNSNYPSFSLSVDYNEKTNYSTRFLNDSLIYTHAHPSLKARLLCSIPLSFRYSAWTFNFLPSMQWEFDNSRWYSAKSQRYRSRSFLYWQTQASVSQTRATRDIKSPLYAGLRLAFLHPTASERYYAYQGMVTAYGGLHLGLIPNDGLAYKFTHHHYYANAATRYMVLPFMSSRGFSSVVAEVMNYHAVDYCFPVNVEFSLPYLLYVKRLETNLFGEMLYASHPLYSTDEHVSYKAAGVELSFVMVPLRLDMEMNIGLRATYSQVPDASGVEMIVGTSF